jgi:hypothetical protein
MTRSRSLILVVVLIVAMAVFDLIPAVRTLSYGSAGAPPMTGMEGQDGPPFWAGIMFVCISMAALFGAYGLWVGQKWGKIVTIITRVILTLFILGDLVGSISAGVVPLALGAGLYFIASVYVLYYVLRRQPRLALAGQS